MREKERENEARQWRENEWRFQTYLSRQEERELDLQKLLIKRIRMRSSSLRLLDFKLEFIECRALNSKTDLFSPSLYLSIDFFPWILAFRPTVQLQRHRGHGKRRSKHQQISSESVRSLKVDKQFDTVFRFGSIKQRSQLANLDLALVAFSKKTEREYQSFTDLPSLSFCFHSLSCFATLAVLHHLYEITPSGREIHDSRESNLGIRRWWDAGFYGKNPRRLEE